MLSEKSREIVDRNNIYFPFEVCAEVVYVLEKVYSVPRENIRNALILLIGYRNISTNDKAVLEKALEFYHIKNSVWVTRQQMAVLFDRDVKTIGKHINNIFAEGELEKIQLSQNLRQFRKKANVRLND